MTEPLSSAEPCVIFACYLPDESKLYVLKEIVESIQDHLGAVPIYCGVQHGSDLRTEQVLQELAPDHDWHFARVQPAMTIDSDAAAFVVALDVLRASRATHPLCYFIHTKAITSGDDALRRILLRDLLDQAAVRKAFGRRGVGSYGPHLTISRSLEDRQAMKSWMGRFIKSGPRFPVMPYFYVHTMWVARGECVARFLSRVDDSFFQTQVDDYSDRWFAERDLPHFVDAICGMKPAFAHLRGNHSTQFVPPQHREFYRVALAWRLRSAPALFAQLLLVVGRSSSQVRFGRSEQRRTTH